jgi:hypothetical protein
LEKLPPIKLGASQWFGMPENSLKTASFVRFAKRKNHRRKISAPGTKVFLRLFF